MTSEYNAAQRLLHKIKQNVSEFELDTRPDTTVLQAGISQDLQTLGKKIAEYRILARQDTNDRKRRMMVDRATALADDHEALKRRPMDTAITMDGGHGEDAFYQRSEMALDNFIAQGVASLGNLREQRGMLQGAHRRILNADSTLGLSKSVITYINRRTTQDKIILVAGMLVTCISIYFIVQFFG
ncbi:protein transport protein bos1 [Linderina macrospora]|uniref:Protein transport protein bos1 n=1 Tax=Linderina macrospora TaxID=4868 RepID=A0ACC1IY71_9FUNG|nr:protein transport protein bos1 [Linderina macrospora]